MKENLSDLISKIESLVEDKPVRNETETKSKIIRPILESLGWSFTEDEVQLEYPVSIATQDYYVDYALLIDDDPVILVEAKALGNELSTKDARQIIDYCRNEGVKWGILTNGQEWRIYEATMGRKGKEAEIDRIALGQFGEGGDVLNGISKESVLSGEIEEYAEKRRSELEEEDRESEKSKETDREGEKPKKGEYAGECPECGSKLVWRKAGKTGEIYRGCTNYSGGCRWNDRSY